MSAALQAGFWLWLAQLVLSSANSQYLFFLDRQYR